MRRVVITGAGTVNALGKNIDDTFAAFREGHCGIGPLELRDIDRLSVKIGAQVRHWNGEDHFDRQQTSLYDRFSQFTLVAADEAMARSGIEMDRDGLSTRTAVVLGTAGGGVSTWDDSYRSVYQDGKNRVHPFVVPRLMTNAATSLVSMRYGIQGPAYTTASACASSNHAMGQAFHLIRSGSVDAALTGGSDAMLCFGGLKAWEGLRVMSSTGCRPFSADRDGMVQGEGAAVFVFEEFEHARSRGADILAEMVGFAMTADAGDIVAPSRQGAVTAITGALTDARLDPDDIGYVNAHGTGTAVNDRTESAALADVFGARAKTLPVSSTKSMHGHVMGGTGAIELLACIMALRDGIVAPTIGYREPDPDCPLDVVPNEAREARVIHALSNAFAFGGLNAVLALKRA